MGDNLAFTDVTASVTNFSFTDGVQTFNSASSPAIETFEVATNSLGQITAWEVYVGSAGNFSILSCNGDISGSDACSPGNGWGIGGAADEVFNSPYVGIVEGAPGIWSASVPEPSTFLLLGSGMFGLCGIRRKLMRS